MMSSKMLSMSYSPQWLILENQKPFYFVVILMATLKNMLLATMLCMAVLALRGGGGRGKEGSIRAQWQTPCYL